MIKSMMNSMMGVMMESMTPDDKQDTMLKMMPEMMKEVKGADMLNILKEELFETMFITHKSRFGFSETVQKIKQYGEDYGWYNPIITDHDEIERNLGLHDPNKVAMVSMCIPRSAAKILKVNPKLGVMMPMQITVYEEDDQVYVVWMNIKMMGKLFGKVVAEVMGDATDMLLEVHKDIIETKEETE
jgi:uncharacterized protein (DUF302 family)